MTPKSQGRLLKTEAMLNLAYRVQYLSVIVASGTGTAWGATAAQWPAPYLLGTTVAALVTAALLVRPCRRRERTLKEARDEPNVTSFRKLA